MPLPPPFRVKIRFPWVNIDTPFKNFNILYFNLNSPRDALFNKIMDVEIGLRLYCPVEMTDGALWRQHRTEP